MQQHTILMALYEWSDVSGSSHWRGYRICSVIRSVSGEAPDDANVHAAALTQKYFLPPMSARSHSLGWLGLFRDNAGGDAGYCPRGRVGKTVSLMMRMVCSSVTPRKCPMLLAASKGSDTTEACESWHRDTFIRQDLLRCVVLRG